MYEVRAARLGPLVAQVKAALDLFGGLCPLCRVSNPQRQPQRAHVNGVLGCPILAELEALTVQHGRRMPVSYLDWMKKEVIYTQKNGCAVCYRCHIPYLHDMLHRAQQGRGNFNCEPQYQDVVASVVFWAFFTRLERIAAEAHFGHTWVDDARYALWLVRTERGESYTNMMRMFLFVVDRMREGQQ